MTPRVVLYVADECGLCRQAREDLTSAGIAFHEARDESYLLRVPVVEVDGAVVTEGVISLLAVRRALRRAAPGGAVHGRRRWLPWRRP